MPIETASGQRGRAVRACIVLTLLGAACVLAAAEDASARIREYMVPMRDGVRLATTVYLPEGQGPWPAVLTRTPYNRRTRGPQAGQRYTDGGYAYVVQDQRGRFDSEGAYRPHEAELGDGYDSVEWAAVQEWSDGKVGLSGVSAMGIAANLAAAAAPPHLVAAYVVVAPRSLFYEGRFIGGVFKEADTGNWMRRQGLDEEAVAAYKKRVVLDQRWLDTDTVFQLHDVEIPIYNVGGWYDLFQAGNIANFRYLQEWGREGARGRQKLFLGPFGHGQLQGDLAYPGGGSLASTGAEELRWFDYWLKGDDNGIMDEPPVTYYQMAPARTGDASPHNGLRSAAAWPPPQSRPTRFYLHADGTLAAGTPSTEGSTTYSFDPGDPVPTVGGLNLTLPLGPRDQREIGERDDVLRFQTPVLDRAVTLVGKIDLELWVSSDAPDTDFMVKLIDIYPDGYEALVLDTAQRARYRYGRRARDVRMLTPGEAVRLDIDLWNTALVVGEGHRLALDVTSSNYPRFEVNANTGEAPGEAQYEPRVARNTVHHEVARPSALILPVLPD